MKAKQRTGAESVWRERLSRFYEGDCTVAEFCRLEGVSNPSFYQWRKRLGFGDGRVERGNQKDRSPSVPDAGSCFLPVNVTGFSAAEIEFPNGVKVRVPATNDEALRTAILAAGDACREVDGC